ncbi:MAG: 2-oxoglutarate/2-oxoacid ferredoxin oxidoreductase subunit beta [Clostridia bacterium]|jgi:2-oxoglutarate ferredoxin oxidoreductase subunit beta|nr:2-oxoglutarate/2-oxoacid ferredoxin oxidoreductase subunit beta [Clostridia bacterium]MDN5322181.1 2-oxoglutarate/2-oxoacid ferredoxin oxidoreductase subunit beta [Clostridia bacterium]
MNEIIKKYFRNNKLPHIWCPGCGNGIVLGALARAVDKLGLDQNKTAVISGIGCSSRSTGYLDFDTIHTAHGRALTFATGLKLARPELNVIVITGDGDCTAIGGNHFIHAARRNIDITTVIFNNNIYGMTGGQYSPLTPTKGKSTTSPYGHIEKPFDIPELAIAAGATYVARGTTYHTMELSKLIANAIEHKGFSVVEALSSCPISFGRQNKLGNAPSMMKLLKEKAISIKAAEKLPPEKLAGKYLIGELFRKQLPEYTEEYQKIINNLTEGGQMQ